MNRKLLACLPGVVCGLLVAIGPQTFAHVCEYNPEMPMACHWTGQAALGIGLLMAALGVIAFFMAPQVRAGLNIANVLNGIFVVLLPTVIIPVCASPMMHCHSVARPTLIVLGVLAAVASAVSVYVDLKAAPRHD